jgi:hypothetical protein
MTKTPDVQVEQVLAYFRELVGSQAQEIALLRATIAELTKPEDKVE